MNFIGFDKMFNEDEKKIMNQVAVRSSKQECVERIIFNINIGNDIDIKNTMDILLKKVDTITTEDWKSLQIFLPFVLTINDYDN